MDLFELLKQLSLMMIVILFHIIQKIYRSFSPMLISKHLIMMYNFIITSSPTFTERIILKGNIAC